MLPRRYVRRVMPPDRWVLRPVIRPVSAGVVSRPSIVHTLMRLILISIASSLLLAAPAAAAVLGGGNDEESALPSRVANAIKRAELSLDGASQAIDGGDTREAVASLTSVRLNLAAADKAGRRQMSTKPSEDAETTPGPDSVVAVLTLDQEAVTRLSGLFNRKSGVLVQSLSSSLLAAQNVRDRLLASGTKLDPEGAGADYADGMADSVGGFDDEVANIAEALADDQLTSVARKVLTAALTRSKAARSRVTNAFGGGE